MRPSMASRLPMRSERSANRWRLSMDSAMNRWPPTPRECDGVEEVGEPTQRRAPDASSAHGSPARSSVAAQSLRAVLVRSGPALAPAHLGRPFEPPLSPLAAALASQEELELRTLILVEHVVANARVAGYERGLGANVQVVRTGGGQAELCTSLPPSRQARRRFLHGART